MSCNSAVHHLAELSGPGYLFKSLRLTAPDQLRESPWTAGPSRTAEGRNISGNRVSVASTSHPGSVRRLRLPSGAWSFPSGRPAPHTAHHIEGIAAVVLRDPR